MPNKFRLFLLVLVLVMLSSLLFSSSANAPVHEPVKAVPVQEQKDIEQTDRTPREIITEYATSHGVSLTVALAVADCESGFDPKVIGDGGESYGLWQIHRPAHPTVTKEQALDPVWSTEWAMKRLKTSPEIWTCYRNLF